MAALEFRVTLTVQACMSKLRLEQMLKDPLSHSEVSSAKMNIQAIMEQGTFGFFFIDDTVLQELAERNVTVSFSCETLDDFFPQDRVLD